MFGGFIYTDLGLKSNEAKGSRLSTKHSMLKIDIRKCGYQLGTHIKGLVGDYDPRKRTVMEKMVWLFEPLL